MIFIPLNYEKKLFLKTNLEVENKKNKFIFTFWEPHEKMPGYLKLCIKTWKKFLPDYDIKVLDYKNVKDYLGENLFSNIICKTMPLKIQADAIRVALLKKFGGIWLDADTIITNGQFINKLKYYELIMLGEEKNKIQNIGFIASSSNSSIINEWLKEIIKKVNQYKENNFDLKKKRKKMKWNYLGNGIIDRLVNNSTGKTFFRLDRNKMNAFPEIMYFENSSLSNNQRYKKFYFRKGDPQFVINNTKGIILLHNTWTPRKFKEMSENKFLKQDVLLSRLLVNLLF